MTAAASRTLWAFENVTVPVNEIYQPSFSSSFAVSALPRRKMKEWACGNGRGYVVRITPSLYMKSGILEVIGEIPQGGAHLINGDQQKLFR